MENTDSSMAPPQTDIFLSHDWGKDELQRNNHDRVRTISDELKSAGYKCWLDEDYITMDIVDRMREGIDGTKAVLIFVTQNYMKKINTGATNDNCRREFNYAVDKKQKPTLCVTMEESMSRPSNWNGNFSFMLGNAFFVRMDGDLSNETYLKNRVEELVEQLQRMKIYPSTCPSPKVVPDAVICRICKVAREGKFCNVCGANLSVSDNKSGQVIEAYIAETDEELTLVVGDVVTNIELGEDGWGWWRGQLNGKTGIFPSNHVELLRGAPVTVDSGMEKIGEECRQSVNVPVADLINGNSGSPSLHGQHSKKDPLAKAKDPEKRYHLSVSKKTDKYKTKLSPLLNRKNDKQDGKTASFNEKDFRYRLLDSKLKNQCSPEQRLGHVSVYDDVAGNIIIYGGYGGHGAHLRGDESGGRGGNFISQIWLYNIKGRTWTCEDTKGTVPTKNIFSGCWLQDNHLYLFGGRNNLAEYSNCLHRLDLNSLQWTTCTNSGDVPSERSAFVCWKAENTVMVFGGVQVTKSGFVDYYNDLYELTILDERMTGHLASAVGPKPGPRAYSAHTQQHNVGYLFGGVNSCSQLNDLYMFDMETHQWAELTYEGNHPEKRFGGTASLVNDGSSLLVYGGFNDWDIFADCWLFQLDTRKWKEICVDDLDARCYQTACNTDEREVVVFGGWDELTCSTSTMGYFRF